MARRDLTAAYEVLRDELIAARKSAGLSQRDIAEQFGAHQQFWSKVESGERRLDLIEFVLVARVLKLDLTAVLKRVAATIGP